MNRRHFLQRSALCLGLGGPLPMTELLHAALDGVTSERELQLYGPPRQVLQLRSFPLRRDGEVFFFGTAMEWLLSREAAQKTPGN